MNPKTTVIVNGEETTSICLDCIRINLEENSPIMNNGVKAFAGCYCKSFGIFLPTMTTDTDNRIVPNVKVCGEKIISKSYQFKGSERILKEMVPVAVDEDNGKVERIEISHEMSSDYAQSSDVSANKPLEFNREEGCVNDARGEGMTDVKAGEPAMSEEDIIARINKRSAQLEQIGFKPNIGTGEYKLIVKNAPGEDEIGSTFEASYDTNEIKMLSDEIWNSEINEVLKQKEA